MKRLLGLALIPIAIALAAACEGQDSNPQLNSFAITIAMPRTEVRLGSPTVLKLAMTSAAGAVIPSFRTIVEGTLLRKMDVKVYDAAGLPVSETEHGMRIHGRYYRPGALLQKQSSFGATGSPLERIDEESDLSKEFDLSKPGKYTVQAERRDGTGQAVKSNVVAFTITP